MRDICDLRAVLYARLSSQTKDSKSGLVRCRAMATAMGWKVSAEYTDYPQRNKRDAHTPGLWQMIEDLRHGRADVMILPNLDTFSRDPDRVLALLIEAQEQGFYLCSLDERLDTSTFAGMSASASFRTLLTWARNRRIDDMRESGIDKLFNETHMPSFRECLERIVALRIEGLQWSAISIALNREGYQVRRDKAWNPKSVWAAYEVGRDIGLFDELTLRQLGATPGPKIEGDGE